MAYIENQAGTPARGIRLGLIGAGWMGAFHGESIVRRIPGAVLEAIADPALDAAAELAGRLTGLVE